MARPDIILCLNTRSQDCSLGKIKDESAYGIDGADDRDDYAQYLLAYKMDEEGEITYIENVVNATPLATLEWDFDAQGDGAYRFFYLIIAKWLVGTAYIKETIVNDVITVYADIVYHNGVVYKAIDPSTGVEPGVTLNWELDWAVVTDLRTLIGYVDKDTIEVVIHNDIITCSFEACIVELLDDTSELVLKGLCDNLEKILPTLKAQLLLDSANSNNWQEKQTRSEVILIEGAKKFCNAC